MQTRGQESIRIVHKHSTLIRLSTYILPLSDMSLHKYTTYFLFKIHKNILGLLPLFLELFHMHSRNLMKESSCKITTHSKIEKYMFLSQKCKLFLHTVYFSENIHKVMNKTKVFNHLLISKTKFWALKDWLINIVWFKNIDKFLTCIAEIYLLFNLNIDIEDLQIRWHFPLSKSNWIFLFELFLVNDFYFVGTGFFSWERLLFQGNELNKISHASYVQWQQP